MKRILFAVVALLLVSGASYAQQFKPFKIGLGLGFAKPAGEGASGGILLYGEPMYRLSDEIALGLRLESAVMARVSIDPTTGNPTDATASAQVSYSASGQYYFSNGSFRPFAGAGLGFYRIGAATADASGNGNGGVNASTKFGLYPRVGFDFGHFNMQLEYNLIGNSTVETLTGEEVTVKNSYLAIKTGFSIFGGRR